MTKRTKEILDKLDEVYTREYKCYLNHENPGQLLIATMLSAQCTDVRVNIVTKDLFVKYPDMQAFAKADLKELEQDIKPTGFYHNKAKNIIGCAQRICQVYGGEVPRSLEDLVSLPGVGRKTANVIRGNIFHEPSVVVDTHVKRISKRLGFTKEEDPEKIEQDLMKVLPKEHWILYNIQIITFGRQICFARSPKCEECFLTEYCKEYKEKQKKKQEEIMMEYVALDLETTGLEPSKDRIIEIGAVKVRNKEVVGEYGTLINPQMEIPDRITELTGISNDMVQGKPLIAQALGELLDFCEELPLLGHNLMFDYSFVKHQAVNAGMVFEKKGMDTLKLARALLPELPSRSLQNLRMHYEIPQKDAHRALEDARTTYLLYERLREEFEEKQPKLFVPNALIYKVKKQGPVTAAQKRYLQDLIKYHRIELNVEIDSLTKNEASREIDKILSTYGKIVR